MTGLPPELSSPIVDACTLNNALNVAQLVVLVVLVRWVHRTGAGNAGDERSR